MVGEIICMARVKVSGIAMLSVLLLVNGAAALPGFDCISCHQAPMDLYPAINKTSFGKHNNINKMEGENKLTNDDCATCHYNTSNMMQPGWTTPTKACTDCHTHGNYSAQIISNHRPNGVNIATTAFCSHCHNNSINTFAYNENASVSHYGIRTDLIPTQDCTYCHNGKYTNNVSWGNPVNISTSTKRQHTETQTSQCDICHKDGNISSLALVDFHNASVKLANLKPPASITGLTGSAIEENYINWTWTDPADLNFDHVEVYINGSRKNDVLRGIQYYNATSLTAYTLYTLSTRTLDKSGNINQTWVNHSAKTADKTSPQTYIIKAWDDVGYLEIKDCDLDLPDDCPITTSNYIEITFNGTDNIGISGFECKLVDSGDWTSCLEMNGSSESKWSRTIDQVDNEFHVRAIDIAGNIDFTPAKFKWKYDKPSDFSGQGMINLYRSTIRALSDFIRGILNLFKARV